MIYQRIIERVSILLGEHINKKQILVKLEEILKMEHNADEVFFDIYKLTGIDIKLLYSEIAPHLFLNYSDNRCCGLIWKVDKYILNEKPIIVPSRCSRTRTDRNNLYCKIHNRPKSDNSYCVKCDKFHEKTWEHFGNIFSFSLNACFSDKNIDKCHRHTFAKPIGDTKCITFADFYLQKNKDKWQNTVEKHIESSTPIFLEEQQQRIPVKKPAEPKRRILNGFLDNLVKSELEEERSVLTDEHRKLLWTILLHYLFNNKTKIERPLSHISIYDKDCENLMTDGKFIYNAGFRMNGIILDDELSVFGDDIDRYLKKCPDVDNLNNNLVKLFIKELSK
jgi:hypothetical protein